MSPGSGSEVVCARPRRISAALAALLATGLLAGCGGDGEASGAPGPLSGTMTGCLRDAGYDVKRVAGELVRVSEGAGGGGAANVLRLATAADAQELAKNFPADAGRAIDKRTVLYRGEVSPRLRAGVESCVRDNPDETNVEP